MLGRCPGSCTCGTGLAAVDVPPSPKFHEYVSGWPSGSEEPELENATFSGVGPEVGFADAETTGAWFDCTYLIRRSLLTPKVPPTSEYPRSR